MQNLESIKIVILKELDIQQNIQIPLEFKASLSRNKFVRICYFLKNLESTQLQFKRSWLSNKISIIEFKSSLWVIHKNEISSWL